MSKVIVFRKTKDRAQGFRFPRGNPPLVADGRKKNDLPPGRARDMLTQAVKAGAAGVPLRRLAADRYARWLVRVLGRGGYLRVARRKAA